MKFIFLSLSLLLITGFEIQALTLAEALAATYQNNPELSASRTSSRRVNETYNEALSGFLPRVSVEGNRGIVGSKSNLTTWTSGLYDQREITLTQPLFSGGASLASVESAKANIASENAQVINTEQNVLLEAVASFLNNLEAEERLNTNLNNVKVLAEHLNSTKKRFEQGVATPTDIALSEARYSTALTSKIKIEGELENLKANFFRLTSLEASALLSPDIQELYFIPPTLDEALELAVKNNPAIVITSSNIDSAKGSEKIALSTLMPQFNFLASYGKTESPVSISGAEVYASSYLFNLSIPIYQSGSEYSKVRQAKEFTKQLSDLHKNTINAVVETTIKAWNNMETAKAAISASKDSVSAAEAAYNGTLKEYEEGIRSNLDVLDNRQNLFLAELEQIAARYNYLKSLFGIRAAVGTLTAKDLELPVDLIDPKKHEKSVRYKFIGF